MSAQHVLRYYSVVLCGVFMISLGLPKAQSGIPSNEERIAGFALNPSNVTWRVKGIRLWPWPKKDGKEKVIMCYRYDFDLPAEAREANQTFHVPIKAKYRVSVNGTAEPFLEKHRVDTRTIDLMPYLKQGHNVLCVTLEGQLRNFQTGVQLVAEGMVYGQDGSIIKLATDKTWTCACDPDKGWDKPGPCPDYMKPVDAGRHPGKYYTLYLPIVPPYHGPIRIQPADMSQPIFDQEKPVELAVTVLNAAKSVVSDQKPGIN